MAQSSISSLVSDARLWQKGDPDEATRRELETLIEQTDEVTLRACFEPSLEFGTAGLRGVVGPGPAKMNVAVIRRVTKALADVVAQRPGGATTAPIVLGFDGRVDSRRFAEQAVGVIAASGRPVAFFDAPIPTPLVAFAGLKLNALASVVVTASHNPPEYNGYKVYGSDGIQIVPPFDREVTERLSYVSSANQVSVDEAAFVGNSSNARRLGEDTIVAYVEAVYGGRVLGAKADSLRVAYSPLHGVGAAVFERVFRRAGYSDVFIEPSQRAVDGRFPTVRFPNPEEPATLERGITLAESVNADVLLVNDPDADRLGVALPKRNGKFRILSGNEIGVILTDFVLSHALEPKRALVTTTLVSSPMTALIARDYGAQCEQTLTGFKWLWTAMRMLEAERGLRFALCWEEALGYSTHRTVRDKDGIAAGLCFADWVSECKMKGQLPLERLGELYRRFGAWGSAPYNLVKPGAAGFIEIQEMLRRLSSQPPTLLRGRKVVRFTDYSKDAERRPVYQGVSTMYVLELENDARIVVRPSGTEPKLKFYADVREPVASDEDPFDAYERARRYATLLTETLVTSMAE